MSSHQTDRHHFERQIVYARPIFILLALLAVLEQPPSREAHRSASFLIAYLTSALLITQIERLLRKRSWHLPLVCDLLALGFFMYISPSTVPVWFPYMFLCYAAGIRWGLELTLPLAGALSLILVLLTAVKGDIHWMRVVSWLGITVGTFAGGAGLAFMGDRNRRFASQIEFFSRLNATIQVDQGLAESLRMLLEELATSFGAEEALLLYRDTDLERIFLWRLKAGESERLVPESMPLSRTDGFLLDDMDATICWNSLAGSGSGFGWDRRDGRALKNLPRLPGPAQQELKVTSFATVAFEQGGQATGRIFLLNGRKPFQKQDLAWFEHIAAHISPALENIFLLRHLRARAIEAERSRIARDLHDGILQTLLSIEIQLDVMRRRLPAAPDQAVSGLASLQQTVKNEGAELRQTVTDLRPLRVQSADLVDLMRGFAERYRNECTVALDLLIDSAQLRAPDRVCREIFQIYREALNNIKKHAKASHVVVKLSQDDSRLVLVVDDNGEGFSFAGRFTGDELDRLRLGPISIKERARTMGGVLTVESNPGHGARLTIEVPLG
ncbi:MAG TPA: sensor histidine kinase [Candidatus Acidoferrales bacterium]|nr:sensor histidine kinase [Candidatus Acidoferrales bacterium]